MRDEYFGSVLIFKGVESLDNNNKILQNQEKDIELQVEKLRVRDTINKISHEMIRVLEKRKQFTNYIKKYRQENLEEYRDDEDKQIEYFDHERFAQEESFKIIDKRLKELIEMKVSPYFGRINFLDKEFDDKEEIYIGRYGLMEEGSFSPTIVDWRAPVASLFYAGTLGQYQYESPNGLVKVDIEKRRQYIIKKGELLGMFDSDLDVKDEILQMVLSGNSNEKLKDIVLTIQKEQDEIIRQPRMEVVVVNGVAGSGKTTIALHRVAYLLYNYRKILDNKVLILGPNLVFMEYISTVLPSLGEKGVKQDTFRDFALKLLDLPEKVMEFSEKMERVMNGDKELHNNIIKKTGSDFVVTLNQWIENLETHYYDIKPVTLRDKVVLTKEEIEEMLKEYYKNMPLFRRGNKIKRIAVSKIKEERDNIFRHIEKKYRILKENLSPEEKNLEENNIEFQRRMEIRALIREVMDCREGLRWLDGKDVEKIYIEHNNNQQLIDEDLAPILYLKIKLWGLKLDEDIKHVVIDEAQDYSLLQFNVIKELTQCKSFTIVGDCNQRLINSETEAPMMELNRIFDHKDVKYFNLKKSYRSTKEIMEYANKFIENESKDVPLVRSGEKVTVKQSTSLEETIDFIKAIVDELKDTMENIAIVCKNHNISRELSLGLKQQLYIKTIDDEYTNYTGGIVIIPSYLAKGLEFDGVIMVDKETDEVDLVKYIMCTRALHRLYHIKLS